GVYEGLAGTTVANEKLEGLKVFWMAMNSVVLLAAVAAFWLFERIWGVCATNYHVTTAPTYIFVVFFGLVVLMRDLLDFSHGWAVLYPVKAGTAPRRVIRLLEQARVRTYGRSIAAVSLVLALEFACAAGILDAVELSRMCSM